MTQKQKNLLIAGWVKSKTGVTYTPVIDSDERVDSFLPFDDCDDDIGPFTELLDVFNEIVIPLLNSFERKMYLIALVGLNENFKPTNHWNIGDLDFAANANADQRCDALIKALGLAAPVKPKAKTTNDIFE